MASEQLACMSADLGVDVRVWAFVKVVTRTLLREKVKMCLAHSACQLLLYCLCTLDRKVRVAQVDDQVNATAIELVVNICQGTQLSCCD